VQRFVGVAKDFDRSIEERHSIVVAFGARSGRDAS
jgi:hypothetical protein